MLIDAYFARKDWTTVVREMRRGQQRILFVVVVVMSLFAVGDSMMLSQRMDKGIGSFVSGVLLLGLFLAVPVWYAFRHRADGWRKALFGFAFFVFVMAKGSCYFGSGGDSAGADSQRLVQYGGHTALRWWVIHITPQQYIY